MMTLKRYIWMFMELKIIPLCFQMFLEAMTTKLANHKHFTCRKVTVPINFLGITPFLTMLLFLIKEFILNG